TFEAPLELAYRNAQRTALSSQIGIAPEPLEDFRREMGLLEHTRFELRDDAARRHHARAEERTRRADLERARSLDEGIGIVDEKHRAVSMEIGEVARAKTPEVASLEREPPFDHAVEKKRLEGGEVKPRHARPEPPEGPAPVLSAPQKVLEDAPLLAIGARNALERLAPAKLLE